MTKKKSKKYKYSVEVPPDIINKWLKKIENEILHQFGWLRDIIKESVKESLRPLAAEIVRKIQAGDVPLLVNENLARLQRDIMRDEVRQAIQQQPALPPEPAKRKRGRPRKHAKTLS